MKTITHAMLLTGAILTAALVNAAPLKVYLMAGQSNMQGFGRVTTFPHMGMDPEIAPLLEKMAHPDGTPRVHEDVWISTAGCAKDAEPGQLTVGYGGGRGDRIGPELTFGIYLQEHVQEPILIIKTAWGGKSLCRDFRPPSAGVHPTHTKALEELRKGNKETAELEQQYAERHGKYYRMMIAHARSVLGDIKKVYPDYESSEGYELAGFVWFQGANDFGEADTYPNRGEPGGFSEYTRLLACLIRDVRKDLKAQEMKAVIGVIGLNGELETERFRQIEPEHVAWLREFRRAMAAPAEMPEFKGSVAAVRTEEFWEPQLEELQGRWKRVKIKNGELKKQGLSKEEHKAAIDEFLMTVYSPEEWKLMEIGVSHACYHYMGSAKIMARIGKGFAEAMIDLEAEDLLAKPLEAVWKAFSEEPGTGLADVWQVKDGVLVCKGTPKGGIYLDRELADFTLRLEWRWPGEGQEGKGGVLLRTVGPWKLWPRSLEAQINAGEAGDFWGLDGFSFAGSAERLKKLKHPQFGKLTHLARTATVENPAGEWNQYEIVAKGPVVTLKVNGQVVNQTTGCDLRPGRICLTAEGNEIQFRNIRLTHPIVAEGASRLRP